MFSIDFVETNQTKWMKPLGKIYTVPEFASITGMKSDLTVLSKRTVLKLNPQ